MLEIGKVLTTNFDDSNFVGVQMESFGEGSQFYEMYNIAGNRYIPLDPDENGSSCSAMSFQDGSDEFAFCGTDPRSIPFLPPPKKGTKTSFNFTGSACDFDHFDENGYSVIVHDGAQDHVISVNKTTHAISIIQKDGTAIELSSDGLKIRTNAGSISLEGNKLQVFGDLACTGSLSMVAGRSLVFADALIARLAALEAAVDGKTPLPGNPAGLVPQTGLSALALAPVAGSTINTIVT